MTARLIDGKRHAEAIRSETTLEVTAFRGSTGIQPHLAVVLVGDDPASAVYVRNKHLACEKAGILSTIQRLPATTSQAELLAVIQTLNHDRTVHGILVQLPLPRGLSEQAVLDAVAPEKDVDCFHPSNVGLMVQGRPRFLPCTPAGVQQLLIRENIPTAGAHIVVLGRSEIVGKPQATLFVQKGLGGDATVTLCHSRTRHLPDHTRSADILVAAIGKARFVTADMVRPGVVVMDVGINRVDDKLVGDVDFGPVSEIASAITPVPGGVGPMTIALLLRNTVTAARLAT